MAIEHQQNHAVQFAVSFNYIKLDDRRDAINTKLGKRQSTIPVSHVQPDGLQKNLLEVNSIDQTDLTHAEFFCLTQQGNDRRASPLHRAVTAGNYVGLRILLESSVLYGSFNEQKNTFLKGLSRECKEALCVDLFV